MHRSRPALAPLALAVALVALAACSKPAATDGAAAAPDATATAAPAATTAPADAPKATGTAASGFVLDMAKVDAYYATIGKITEMSMADPSLNTGKDGEEEDHVSMDASESVDEYIARLEADPKAKRLVTSAGMSVSDFAHTNAAMLEGMMGAGLMEATGKKDLPPGINRQYVEFAQQHKAELEAKIKALQARYSQE